MQQQTVTAQVIVLTQRKPKRECASLILTPRLKVLT
jgi:hypothetical protein